MKLENLALYILIYFMSISPTRADDYRVRVGDAAARLNNEIFTNSYILTDPFEERILLNKSHKEINFISKIKYNNLLYGLSIIYDGENGSILHIKLIPVGDKINKSKESWISFSINSFEIYDNGNIGFVVINK